MFICYCCCCFFTESEDDEEEMQLSSKFDLAERKTVRAKKKKVTW